MRTHHVTETDIQKWDKLIDNDPHIPSVTKKDLVIREVLYSGLWLREQLENLNCDPELIMQIIYTGGALCFGRDPWEVHETLLLEYQNGTLTFDDD